MQERQTKQKQMVYEALTALDHPTATQVYARVREFQPTVSRATVFRVLSGFSSSGRAREIRSAGDEVRYDYNVTPHAHAKCLGCGQLADVEMTETPSIVGRAEKGFCVEGYAVEFYGKCRQCQKKEEK